MPVCSLLYGLVPKLMLPYLIWIMIVAILITGIIILCKIVRAGIDYFPRKKPYEISIPELSDLANKMGYHLTQNPFWIIDKKNIKARIRPEQKQIIFEKDFFNQLTSAERIFVGGHEFFHLYGKQHLYPPIAIIPVAIIAFLIPNFLGVPFQITVLGCFGSMILMGIFSARSIELLADHAGVIHVNKEIATSALKKAYPGRTNRAHDFHPSIDKRIEKL